MLKLKNEIYGSNKIKPSSSSLSSFFREDRKIQKGYKIKAIAIQKDFLYQGQRADRWTKKQQTSYYQIAIRLRFFESFFYLTWNFPLNWELARRYRQFPSKGRWNHRSYYYKGRIDCLLSLIELDLPDWRTLFLKRQIAE